MRGNGLVTILASLIVGILLAKLLDLPLMSSIPFLIAAAVAMGLSFVCRARKLFRFSTWLNIACSVFLSSGLGIFSFSSQRPVLTGFEDGKYSFSGRVLDYKATSGGDRALVELYSLIPASKGIKNPRALGCRNIKGLITLSDVSKVTYGTTISGVASLRDIGAKENVRNDEYVDFQKNRGILLKGFTEEGDVHSTGNSAFFLLPWMARLRDDMEIAIERTKLSPEAKSFLISVALGDKSSLQDAERQAFVDGGVAHIFAVSGMHVGMMSVFILIVLTPFFRGRRRRWKYLLALPLVWFYVLLTGFSPATQRAGIMFTIAFVALFLERKHSPIKSLGWAIVLILIFTPQALFDVGLQLSAACVGSLILIAGPLTFVDHRNNPKLYYTVSLLLVTLVATFSTWVISAFYFHTLSIMFIPANILAVPLLPFYLAISSFYVVLSAIGLDIGWLADFLNYAYDKFLASLNFFNSLSTPLRDLHIGPSTVFLWMAGIAVLGYILSAKRLKRLWIPMGLFAAALLAIPLLPGTTVPNGFIIQKKSDSFAVASYENGKESIIEFLPEAVSSITLAGKNILMMDRNPLDSLSTLDIKKADYIILGKGLGADIYDIHSVLMEMIGDNTTIVTHPSLHWRREKKLLETTSSTHHSLRYDGPLHYFPP